MINYGTQSVKARFTTTAPLMPHAIWSIKDVSVNSLRMKLCAMYSSYML